MPYVLFFAFWIYKHFHIWCPFCWKYIRCIVRVQSYLQGQTCLIFSNNLYQISMKQLLLMSIKVLQVHVTNLAFHLCSDENPIGPSSIFMRCGWITLHAWFVDCCLSKGSGGINFTNQHSLLCTLKDTMHKV